jgi:integrase
MANHLSDHREDEGHGRRRVKRFAVKFPLLRDVSRPAVRRWITSLMNDDGLTPKTVQRILSALRGYWRFLQGDGIVPEADEPFAKLEVARQAKGRGGADLRQPFEPADVPKLIAGALADDDAELADLIRLAMWTGCRIEELCALKVADVNGNSFRVVAAKSDAGVRVVPIQSSCSR